MTDFVNNLLGTSLTDGVALAVLAGMALLAVLAVWLLLKAIRQPGFAGRRGKQARIAITDATRIDDRRRLVLVRRDDVEHLVLIGGANDLLVETDIRRVAPARERVDTPAAPARPTPVPMPDDPAETRTSVPEPPRAPEPARVPEPPRAPAPEPASKTAERETASTSIAPASRTSPPEPAPPAFSASKPTPAPTPTVAASSAASSGVVAPAKPEPPKVELKGDAVDDLNSLLKGFGARRD